MQRDVDYTVTVDTTDLRGNGMDGRAMLTLHGARGSSPELELSDSSDSMLFERGTSKTLTVTAPDVGILSAVTVRLTDPSYDSLHTGWHLAKVAVVNPGTGKRHTFKHNAWLVGPDKLSARLEDKTGGEAVQDAIKGPVAAPSASLPAVDAATPPSGGSSRRGTGAATPQRSSLSNSGAAAQPTPAADDGGKDRRPSFAPSEPFSVSNEDDLINKIAASSEFDNVSIRSNNVLQP